MNSLHDIAVYTLSRYKNQITPMKLQKLLYYVKVWSLVAGRKIISFDSPFYAWKFGPVNKSIYYQYSKYGGEVITEISDYNPINSDQKELLDFILDSYAVYSAATLSQTTHIEEPWLNNKETGGKITDKEILSYYSNESYAKNFPLEEGKRYYPPNTSSHASFIFDMDKNDKASIPTFSSLEEYLTQFSINKEKVKQILEIN